MDRTAASDAKTIIINVSSSEYKTLRNLIKEQKPTAEDWADKAKAVSVVVAPQSGVLNYKLGTESWVDALSIDADVDRFCEIALTCILTKIQLKASSGSISVRVIVFTE